MNLLRGGTYVEAPTPIFTYVVTYVVSCVETYVVTPLASYILRGATYVETDKC